VLEPARSGNNCGTLAIPDYSSRGRMLPPAAVTLSFCVSRNSVNLALYLCLCLPCFASACVRVCPDTSYMHWMDTRIIGCFLTSFYYEG
jgi:hypothetical protein